VEVLYAYCNLFVSELKKSNIHLVQVIPAKDQQFYVLLHNNSQPFRSLLAIGTWERINSSKLLVTPSSWSDFASSSFMRPGFVAVSNSSTLPTKVYSHYISTRDNTSLYKKVEGYLDFYYSIHILHWIVSYLSIFI